MGVKRVNLGQVSVGVKGLTGQVSVGVKRVNLGQVSVGVKGLT